MILAEADPPPDAPPNARRQSPVGRALASIDLAWWALAGIIAVWIVVFGRLVWLRHDRFSSFGFDMAIFDQAV